MTGFNRLLFILESGYLNDYDYKAEVLLEVKP